MSTIIGGLSWSLLSKLCRQVIQLVFIFVLSRILSPAEFGLMSMVTAFSMLAEIVRNMGMGAAVIQQQQATNQLYDTAFCFNIVVGTLVFLVFFFTAPLIAIFYKQPLLTDLIRVFASVYVIGSLNIVQEALLQKSLAFKRLFFMDLLSVTISGVLAVYLAWKGWGVWSLVFQYMAMITVSTVVLWVTAEWKPRLRFHRETFRNMRMYSMSLFAHDVVYFFGRDTDKFVIGKYAGADALGIYYRAYMLMLLPVNQINNVITKVMFPVFARMQHDLAAMRQAYLKATRLIAFVSFPIMSLLFLLAEPIILLLLGRQWLEVAWYLRVFCIYGMVESISTTVYWIYKSTGKTMPMLRWGIISTIIIIATVIISMRWGVRGVAIGYTLVQLVVLWIPGWMIAFRIISLPVKDMLLNIGPAFINSLVMAAGGWGLHLLIKGQLPPLLEIVITSLVCGGIYLLLSALTKQEGFRFIYARLLKRRGWTE
jgi:O-antigen/teichoic acid export membrane protein